MKEKIIETAVENTGAIAGAVTKSGLGTRALVIGGSALLASVIGIGGRCLFKLVKGKFEKPDIQVTYEEPDNVTSISEAIGDLAEEDNKEEK